MKIRGRKHNPLALCIGFSCCWPATALAQDCSDKTKLLSDEWFLTKLDCGADKLVEAGAGVLSDAGLKLAEVALDGYFPALSDFLFNHDDPFAEDVAELKLHIEAQADRIIDEMMAGRSRTQTAEFIAAMNALRDFGDDPMSSRAVNLDSIQEVNFVLDQMTVDLKYPLAATWNNGPALGLDYEQMAPRDVDRIHALMAITGYRAELFPMLASAESYAAIVNDYDEPTSSELDVVVAQSNDESLSDLDFLLDDLEPYLAAISSKDLFSLRSDQRFSAITAGNACGFTAYTYSKAAIGRDPLAEGSEHYAFHYHDDGLRGTPPACYGTYAGTGAYRIVHPDGTETTGRTSQPAFFNLVQWNYGFNRFSSYQSFLLSAYGGVRPAISRWYRLASRNAPTLTIDQSLSDALHGDETAAMVLNALPNMADAPLSVTDWRAAEDMILESGVGKLYTFGVLAGADFLNDGGPHPIGVVRRFLYGDVGSEIIRHTAVAKFVSITQL